MPGPEINCRTFSLAAKANRADQDTCSLHLCPDLEITPEQLKNIVSKELPEYVGTKVKSSILQRGGSTLTTVCLTKSGKLVWAMLGDSPFYIFTQRRAESSWLLTTCEPHNYTNKLEREALERQGRISGIRLHGQLAVYRSIGDLECQTSKIPTVGEVDVKDMHNFFVVLASDGLTDAFPSTSVCIDHCIMTAIDSADAVAIKLVQNANARMDASCIPPHEKDDISVVHFQKGAAPLIAVVADGHGFRGEEVSSEVASGLIKIVATACLGKTFDSTPPTAWIGPQHKKLDHIIRIPAPIQHQAAAAAPTSLQTGAILNIAGIASDTLTRNASYIGAITAPQPIIAAPQPIVKVIASSATTSSEETTLLPKKPSPPCVKLSLFFTPRQPSPYTEDDDRVACCRLL